MTSGTFDGTTCGSLNLDFDQDFSNGSGNILVEYFDGSAWNSIYTANASTTAHQTIALPTLATNMQLRFTANLTSRTSDYWSIDNVVVSGPEVLVYDWLRLDGGLTVNGVVSPSGTDAITVGCDATGCPVGLYTADVTIDSDDPDESSKVVTVEFTVASGTVVPAIPSNIVTSISGTNLVVDWDVSADATSYDVYSSDDPYGTFTFVTNVGTNQYTVAANQAKLFYYIVAKN